MSTKKKQAVIDEFKVHKTDTGSTDVQVALLTEQIKKLVKHLKEHSKDNHSRRGLLKMVADRRSLMNYLAKKNKRRHNEIVKKLNLKKK